MTVDYESSILERIMIDPESARAVLCMNLPERLEHRRLLVSVGAL
jgi:hypothetical protein